MSDHDEHDRYSDVGVIVWKYTQTVVVVPRGCTAEMDDGRTVEGPAFLMTPPTIEAQPAS